jgi:hypothetical protein
MPNGPQLRPACLSPACLNLTCLKLTCLNLTCQGRAYPGLARLRGGRTVRDLARCPRPINMDGAWARQLSKCEQG